MTEFKLIQGIHKGKPDYRTIYTNMFFRSLGTAKQELEETETYSLDTKRKLLLSGVKMINADRRKDMDYEELMHRFNLISFIKTIAAQLTPNEFQTVFPIDKEYDGDRYQMKDYFFTKKFIKTIGEDNPIGENVNEFFWDYQNLEIRMFGVNLMSVMSDIRRVEGKKGLLEEFAENVGITTYTLHENDNGKKFLTNNETGETVPVKKLRPKYLKPL